jgi:hypothetical protein
VTEETQGDPIGERAYQRRFRDKGNKREDWAVDVFREALAHLDDPPRVDRLLGDLARYYNALTNGPLVDVATRRRVGECLAAGAAEQAATLIRACLDRYRGGIDDGLDPLPPR